MEHFLAIDVGTTAVKVALIDRDGIPVSVINREYSLETPSENIVELDPRIYWDCACDGIRAVLEESGVSPGEILSIGISSQGETLIVLDEKGEPLSNAIVWLDNRSHAEALELKERFGVGNTGLDDMIATWPVTKALWLKKHKPQLFREISTYLMVEDYIIYRLTGSFVGEYSLYSTTAMLDINAKDYWMELLDYIGIERGQLVELRESGETVGKILPDVADEVGLSRETIVTTGAMDQTAGMVGAGNIEEGIVTETTGSALAICKTMEKLTYDRGRSIAVQCHAVPGKYLATGWCAAGGLSLKWLRDTFFTHEIRENGERDPYEVMTAMAEQVPIGSQGLIFFPFMSGPGTLPVDPEARGCFYGIELHHKKPHFVRAVLESVAYVLRENIERMEALGGKNVEVRAMGGGAKSRLWNQIKADVTGIPVVTMRCSETASLGVAILSSVALGMYPSIEQACKHMIEQVDRYSPNTSNHEAYEQGYTRYCEIEERFFGI